jgi:hypothetical protein
VPAAYASLGDMAPADLAHLLSAYAAVPYYSQELFAAATEFLWEALPRLAPGQLAEAAAAYAAVGHYDDDEDLWNGIAERAAALAHVGGGRLWGRVRARGARGRGAGRLRRAPG